MLTKESCHMSWRKGSANKSERSSFRVQTQPVPKENDSTCTPLLAIQSSNSSVTWLETDLKTRPLTTEPPILTNVRLQNHISFGAGHTCAYLQHPVTMWLMCTWEVEDVSSSDKFKNLQRNSSYKLRRNDSAIKSTGCSSRTRVLFPVLTLTITYNFSSRDQALFCPPLASGTNLHAVYRHTRRQNTHTH